MRQRTKQFLMGEEKINAVLQSARVGRLGVITKEMKPYIVPVNFALDANTIYIHGAAGGLKMESMQINKNVCFEVDEEYGLRMEDPQTQCNVGEKYESVIAFGTATEITDDEKKAAVLRLFIDKYAPELKNLPMPAPAIKGTAVVGIDIDSITGKERK